MENKQNISQKEEGLDQLKKYQKLYTPSEDEVVYFILGLGNTKKQF